MNDITLPRATVEQALEALESLFNWKVDPERGKRCGDAVVALRAALAQQAEPVEPVAKVELMMTGGNAGLATRIVEIDDHLRERLRPGQLLYTAPPQRVPLTVDTDCHTQGICQRSGYGITQQAEPVEPVAWAPKWAIDRLTGKMGAVADPVTWGVDAPLYVREAPDCAPLYPAPPQRVPLTDEEILDAVGWERAEMYMKLTPNFPADEAKKETLKNARAIERAHGIGRQSDPQVEDRLARHGIPMPEAPACPDCHGVGYDASGQTCACQENPSF